MNEQEVDNLATTERNVTSGEFIENPDFLTSINNDKSRTLQFQKSENM